MINGQLPPAHVDSAADASGGGGGAFSALQQTTSLEDGAMAHQSQSQEFSGSGGEVDMLMGFFMMNGACIGEWGSSAAVLGRRNI